MRSMLPVMMTITAALLVFITFFLPVFTDDAQLNELAFGIQMEGMGWMMVIGSIAAGLGAFSLIQVHLPIVMRRKKQWWRSLILLVTLVATIVIGLGWGIANNTVYEYILGNIYSPLVTSLMSLLAFFLVAAAFRAFKIRSMQAALLVISAGVVILGLLPIGTALWGGLDDLGRWILEVPGMAGLRGIGLGASLAAIAIMLRVILGLERSYHIG